MRALLLGMRSRGLLDGQALLAEMKKRGHGTHAMKMLKEQIDKTRRTANQGWTTSTRGNEHPEVWVLPLGSGNDVAVDACASA